MLNATFSSRCRSGGTLVECLAALAILGILLALLLPAVQNVREASRRTNCVSHLRQIGLAVHAYHDANGVLPVSYSPWNEGPRPGVGRSGVGWIVQILPHLEQEAVYDRLSLGFRGSFFSGGGLMRRECRAAMRSSIPLLVCPSNGSPKSESINQAEWWGIPVFMSSYKGVLGDSRLGGEASIHKTGSVPDCHSRGGCNGLFWRVTYQEPIRLADITDGLSNSAAVGEDLFQYNSRSAAFYANGDYASCFAPLNYFAAGLENANHWKDVMSFRSRHPGGVNFAFADGSVRFISEGTRQETLCQQCTRHGDSGAVK